MESRSSFGYWVHRRRKALDVTQAVLARQVGCSTITIKKIEADERRPSDQMATRLADCLQIPDQERGAFLRAARSEQGVDPLAVTNQTGATRPLPVSTPSNLPAQLTSLLGRQTEVAELTRMLADPAVRLLTVTGPGGIGKTHLALEAAQQILDGSTTSLRLPIADPETSGSNRKPKAKNQKFPDGVYFVALAPLPTHERLPAALAEALEVHLAADRDPQRQLQEHLRPKQLLLVLDNFEHLLGGVELLVDLLRAAHGLKLLVTSRVALQAPGEQLFPLEGLAFPPLAHLSDAGLDQYSAVELFVQSARRLLPHFVLTAENAGAVGEICRLVYGLPLGILLAAAWLPTLTPTAIAGQLATPVDGPPQPALDLLATEWRATPERHRSLRAVFDHSWCLLGEQEQVIFPQLALFRGGFSTEAAHTVTGATPRHLLALVNASLVQHQANGRYELHELVRQYAAEKLAQTPDAGYKAHKRHATHYTSYLRQCYAIFQQAAPQGIAAFESEVENIRTAWEWAVNQRHSALLMPTVGSLYFFYDMLRHPLECEALFRATVEKLAAVISPSSSSLEEVHLLASVWSNLAEVLALLGKFGQAEHFFHQSLAGWERLAQLGRDTRYKQVFTLKAMGRAVFSFDRRRGHQLYEQSLAVAQTLADDAVTAQVLADLADAAWNLGHYAEARQWLQQNFTLWEKLNDKIGRAWTLNLLGIVALHQGHLAEAEHAQRACLALFQTMNVAGGIAHALAHLGVTLVWAGRFEDGKQTLTELLTVYHTKVSQQKLAFAYNAWGEVWLQLGDYARACEQAEVSLAIAHNLNDRRQIGLSLLTLGQARLAQGTITEAQQALQESVTVLQAIEQRGALGWSLACLGYTAYKGGDIQRAQHHLAGALQIAVETGAFFPLLVALPAIALLCIKQEAPTHAVALYTLARRYPLVANSQWFDEVAGQEIRTITARMTPDGVTAAQVKGGALDPWETARHWLARLREGHIAAGRLYHCASIS